MIQCVNRSLDIMLCVSDMRGQPITISEISKKTGINESTCCHIIETLLKRGFLKQISRSAGYVLGIYSYTLTRYKDFHHGLIMTCSPILDWLERKTGYTVVLANLIDGEKFVLSYSESPENSLKDKGDLYKGTLYDSATGRAMLATMSEKELKNVVANVGLPNENEWPEVTDFKSLLKELKKQERLVRVDMKDDGDKHISKFGVAFIPYKQERFAIGLDYHSKTKPTDKEIKNIEKEIIIAANEIERRIKFSMEK